MKIKIDQNIAPFSGVCGTKVMIPGTTFSATIFPTKIEFFNLEKNSSEAELELYFKIKGPIKKFQVFQNIEKSFVEVMGFSLDGFFRYRIGVADKSIVISFEKTPKGKIEILSSHDNKPNFTEKKDRFVLPINTKIKEKISIEKLSFGVHKAQDIELINRRGDLNEIFPIWFALGQTIPHVKSKFEGVGLLLEESEKLISEKRKDDLESLFQNIFQAGFTSIFVPSLSDEKHLGVIEEEKQKISKNTSALILLEKGYEIIRSLFISQDKNNIEILGCLLPTFHSGRMVNFSLESIGIIDIEWSKKLLKKMILRPYQSSTVRFKLQSSIKSFRMRTGLKDKGKVFHPESDIPIENNQIYYFDRFQK